MACTGKPLIISTGMATLGEIEEAYGKHVQVLVDTSALPGQYMLKFLTAQGREVKPQKG